MLTYPLSSLLTLFCLVPMCSPSFGKPSFSLENVIEQITVSVCTSTHDGQEYDLVVAGSLFFDLRK